MRTIRNFAFLGFLCVFLTAGKVAQVAAADICDTTEAINVGEDWTCNQWCSEHEGENDSYCENYCSHSSCQPYWYRGFDCTDGQEEQYCELTCYCEKGGA